MLRIACHPQYERREKVCNESWAYVFTLNLAKGTSSKQGEAAYIDAYQVRNLAAFINFGCTPNLEPRAMLSLSGDRRTPWRPNDGHSSQPCLFFVPNPRCRASSPLSPDAPPTASPTLISRSHAHQLQSIEPRSDRLAKNRLLRKDRHQPGSGAVLPTGHERGHSALLVRPRMSLRIEYVPTPLMSLVWLSVAPPGVASGVGMARASMTSGVA